MNTWLPSSLESRWKFVLTMRKSSEYYAELKAKKECVAVEINTFKNDKDYHSLFSKILDINSAIKDNNNVLFGKYLSIFNDFKVAHHASNPLYTKLIAHEIFSFDKDIFKSNPIHVSDRYRTDDSATPSSIDIYDDIKAPSSLSYSSMSSNSVRTANSVSVMESYFEEISTLRELIQKIIKRYIKKNNWSTNSTIPISIESQFIYIAFFSNYK